ncbi:MAG: hypothetical protein ACYSU0_12785 [Planctomycetota bacterium]
MPGTTGSGIKHGARAICLDTTASRFTGASIAGLVVGAMGVFVFAAAFLHWRRQRRRHRDGRFTQNASHTPAACGRL